MKKILLVAILALFAGNASAVEPATLLNVSYDPTRELYDDYNKAFAEHWKKTKGQDVVIKQSHGGSGKQARSVIDGLEADVVTLALAYDVDAIAEKSKKISPNWQTKLPNNSSPYTSTIVFLVKKGNPKSIKDWGDLVKEGVQVITPNPKTSGGARWNFLAAYKYALDANKADEKAAKEFARALYKNVPILDSGARGATTTFVQRGIGDVLITWEDEALIATKKFAKGKFEIVYPSSSILAEPPVAVVEKNAEKKGNAELAKAYLEYLYSPEAQDIIAKHFYRPSDKKIAAKYASQFPAIKLSTIADFGGWKAAQKKFFDDGGVFDEIYKK